MKNGKVAFKHFLWATTGRGFYPFKSEFCKNPLLAKTDDPRETTFQFSSKFVGWYLRFTNKGVIKSVSDLDSLFYRPHKIKTFLLSKVCRSKNRSR